MLVFDQIGFFSRIGIGILAFLRRGWHIGDVINCRPDNTIDRPEETRFQQCPLAQRDFSFEEINDDLLVAKEVEPEQAIDG